MVDGLQKSTNAEVAGQEERPFVQSRSIATGVCDPTQVGRFGHGKEKDGTEEQARDAVPEAGLICREIEQRGAKGLQAGFGGFQADMVMRDTEDENR